MAHLASFLLEQHKAYLSSVCSSSRVHTAPTPISTPTPGHVAPGQSFGSVATPQGQADYAGLIAGQQAELSSAWSSATRFLSFPRPDDPVGLAESSFGERPRRTSDITKAIQLLLREEDASKRAYGARLTEWYTREVQSHFRTYFYTQFARSWRNGIECQHARTIMESTAARLKWLFRNYMQPIVEHILPLSEERTSTGTFYDTASSPIHSKLRREIQTTLMQSIPSSRFFSTLSFVLFEGGCQVFRLHPASAALEPRGEIKNTRAWMTALLQDLQETGLGGSMAQRAFAQAMERLMSEFIVSEYMKVDWFGKTSVVKRLYDWVQEGFTPFVTDVLHQLNDEGREDFSLAANEVRQWQDMAVIRLGKNRVENLFDYIVNWDNSLGAILDLKEYISTPSARNHLTTSFCRQLTRRLLHAGATTTQILDGYIFVIRAFNELDSKGVLLDRVAKPIRRYLRDREDTARVIITSLLADAQNEAGERVDSGGDVSIEIAAEMTNPAPPGGREQDQALDWNNMAWTPDPVDAGPGFKKPASEDIISDLLSLYDREDFIAELKNILGEQLLKNDESGFEKEIRLLELFKVRLGEDKLQACEVMLRDVLESKRINASIKSVANHASPIELNAQILSRFFWPALRDDTFLVPAEVQSLQAQYARGFERVKDMRKLEWLPSLGRASVELQFEDRSIDLDVQPWQASVIYAFQSEDPAAQSPTRSVEELEELLEMDESLVRNALSFWVGKRVLAETSEDHFAVLERLDAGSTGPNEAAAALAAEEAEAEAVSAVRSQEDMLLANMDLYRQFISAMLLNQGSMPSPKILMMLKMVVPGGFPFGPDEIRSVLGKMVDEGSLTARGDVYSVRKDEN